LFKIGLLLHQCQGHVVIAASILIVGHVFKGCALATVTGLDVVE
jgi:hypothetical protein